MSVLLRLWDYLGILVLGIVIGSFIQFIHDKKKSENNVVSDPMFVPAEVSKINSDNEQLIRRDKDFKRIFNYIKKTSKKGKHWIDLTHEIESLPYYGNIDPDLFYDIMTDLGYTIHDGVFLGQTNKEAIIKCMKQGYRIRISWDEPKQL